MTNYKSTRLLIEAINKAMDAVRKAAMGNIALPWDHLNELRDLVDELAKKADRTAVEDLPNLSPANYVVTMKPLVTTFHRQLMAVDKLAACLCEDLQAAACVLILVGDERTVVRAAHDSNRPEITLVVETILAALDGGVKQISAEVVPALEQLSAPTCTVTNATALADERMKLLEGASGVGWDTDDGMALRKQAKALCDEEDDEEAERP